MNIAPRNPEPVDEQEWQAQERALREERSGAIVGDDPLLERYRQVARALRRPLPDAPPADFARSVASVASAHASPDLRLEQWLLHALSALLALSGVAAMALYGSQLLRGFALLLPPGSVGTTLNWALALGACLGLSWSLERLRRRVHNA